MKYVVSVILLVLSVQLVKAQSIKFESDYKKALKYAKKKDALVLFFFVNGKDNYTETNIEDNVLKSSNFKNAIKASIVIVKVNESENAKVTKYNKRIVLSYNPEKTFPSILVTNIISGKKTSLLSSFNDKDIIAFVDEINTLNN